MPKGYWVARVDVLNADGYRAYVAANAEAFARYGGRFLVRAGQSETVEGQSRARNIVIEFPDYATALACYRSDEYQRAMALRQGHSVADLIIIEGYEGHSRANEATGCLVGCKPRKSGRIRSHHGGPPRQSVPLVRSARGEDPNGGHARHCGWRGRADGARAHQAHRGDARA